MKTCFKCLVEKPIDAFYAHPQMPDGHLNKCKECTKRDVTKNRRENVEYYHSYDNRRARTPKRRQQASLSLARNRNSPMRRARVAVGNAIRASRLIRQPCEVCGELKVEAHHTDYSKPLQVQWLCFKHHRELGHGQQVTLSVAMHSDVQFDPTISPAGE